ncbi:hypothetical protein M91_17933 [Bos mutus]|uniref:Uncharacterized protein n=1 Tax=Bos mutus TaxID=72004 RepID=L8HWF4_9CETA|nr:hypothetical protein M91_17933 [Bos mutus]
MLSHLVEQPPPRTTTVRKANSLCHRPPASTAPGWSSPGTAAMAVITAMGRMGGWSTYPP